MSQPTTNTPTAVDPVVPIQPNSEFLDRTRMELDIRLKVRQEYEALLQIWKDDELAKLSQKQEEVIAAGLQDYFEGWKKDQKPPTVEQIQELLDQEYVTFTLPVTYVKDDDTTAVKTFTIRELPQTLERRFFKQFKENITNKISDLEALVQSDIDAPFDKKVKAGLEMVDEGFDVMAEAVLIIINPYKRHADIDKAWVQNNIGSDRQWQIIKAQMEVNRLRDFFSKVSTNFQDMTTMKRPNIQTLLQRVP